MQNLQAVPVTMSSREIAELTGKRHDNVMADIRKMLEELEFHSPEFSGEYKDSTGRSLPCFHLPRREVEILLTGYSIPLRAKCLDRLRELEHSIVNTSIAQPEPFRLPTPIETKAQLEALQAVMSNDELKKCAPLVWQHLSDALQNQALAFIGVGMLPAPSSPSLLDVVEIAKRNGIDLPANLRSSAGKYVKARVQATEVERIVNGSTRRTSAYSDHAAVAECIRQYLDGRK